MHWLRRKIRTAKRSHQWDINIIPSGRFQIIEITDHGDVPWDSLDDIWFSLIDQTTYSFENIIVCQLLDPDQGMDLSTFQLDRLQQEFGLQTRIGMGYCKINSPGQMGSEITIFAAGKRDMSCMSWLKKILRFGGASLPHIVYGIDRIESNWMEAVEDWNRSFTKWYWLETDASEIVHLREKVKGLFWTSDRHLNVLLEENEVEGFLQKVRALAKEKGLIPHIVPGG